MADYLGSCLCGNTKFEVQGDLDSFYLCHCQHCQKDTGSAYAANLFLKSAKLTWLAGSEDVTTFTLPGSRHKKGFCKFCGSALPSIHEPGLLVIPAGSLDTEVFMSPTAHIFTSRKAGWEEAMNDIPEFEGLPEPTKRA
ncbi:GFA family protein [Halomonas sp. 7T]|uniref:GFA family protein n=1 Tax=Halomonas sp. 7T TaxID=2893469 RepID=UPI0021DAB69E|nr:GFA family protein [Halomonas sp. 7T]UXZ55876.1 GFA family protein [Halomonas sp. 7T]